MNKIIHTDVIRKSEDLQNKMVVFVFGEMSVDDEKIELSPGSILLAKDEENNIYIYTKKLTKEELKNVEPEVCVCKETLDKIYSIQEGLLAVYSGRKEYENLKKSDLITHTLLALIEEAVEIKNELGLKPWKNFDGFDRKKILEEVADLTHFYLQLLILLDISPEELGQAYVKKAYQNFLRQISVPEYATEDIVDTPEKLVKVLALLYLFKGGEQ